MCVCVCVRAGGGRKKENTQFSLFCDLQKRRDFVCLFLLLCGSESVRSLIRQLRSRSFSNYHRIFSSVCHNIPRYKMITCIIFTNLCDLEQHSCQVGEESTET